MDHNHHRHRRRLSSDRFLSTFSPPTTTTLTTTSDDFSEDDIFSTTVSPTTTNHHQPPPQPPLRHNNSFSNLPSGILAALHNSPSRTISVIPQHRKSPLSLSPKYPQSAPMHVPFSPTFRQRGVVGDAVNEDEDEDDEDEDEDGEMLPPHELVAKRLAETPVLSTSVLEGAGRTLKGRDLRQVRNAVFRHTGFID